MIAERLSSSLMYYPHAPVIRVYLDYTDRCKCRKCRALLELVHDFKHGEKDMVERVKAFLLSLQKESRCKSTLFVDGKEITSNEALLQKFKRKGVVKMVLRRIKKEVMVDFDYLLSTAD